MKSYDGYLKRKLGDNYVLLAGGNYKSLNDIIYGDLGCGSSEMTDPNDVTKSGFYYGNMANRFSSSGLKYGFLVSSMYTVSTDYRFQLFTPWDKNELQYRRMSDGTWQDPVTIYHTGNLPAYPIVNNASLTLQTDSTTQTTFYANDSTNRTFNVTCANIGAATSGHNHDSTYVNVTGDTMSGALNIKKHGGALYFGTDNLYYVGSNNATDFYMFTSSAADLRFGTSGIDRMTIKSGGNIGVGISSPSVALDVEGSVKVSRYFLWTAYPGYGSGTAEMYYDASNGWIRYNTPGNINLAGNLVLHAGNYTNYAYSKSTSDSRYIPEPTRDGSTEASVYSFRTYNTSSETGLSFKRSGTLKLWIGTYNDNLYLYNGNYFRMYSNRITWPNSVVIGVDGGSARATLDLLNNNANMIIGKTLGGGGASGRVALRLGLGTVGHTGAEYWAFWIDDLTSDSWLRIGYAYNASPYFGIKHDATVYAPSFYTSSDKRLKQNIIKISDNIKQFEWKESGETSYGFVAQDLEKKHPELVSDNGDTKTVNYNAAICLLLSKLENRLERIERELNIERREEDEII